MHEETIHKTNRQLTEWDKIFANDMADNCGATEDFWESLEQQGDQTSQS